MALADAVGEIVNIGAIPVVLGGDCSIVLGCLLALKRHGRYGLLFLDGHADFYQPEAEPNGEAASMDLALATGRGPAIVTDIERRRPLVRDEDVVVLGRRDAADAEEHGSQRIEDTAIEVIDLVSVRKVGAETAAVRGIERLSSQTLIGFWVHLDADVLDDAIMPAVDYRMPGGPSWYELAVVLRAAAASGRMVGINITIFNPKLDRDGAIAIAFVDALATGLNYDWSRPGRTGEFLQESNDPSSVIVAGVAAQHPARMRLAKDDDVIQVFPANGSNHSFGKTVLPGTPLCDVFLTVADQRSQNLPGGQWGGQEITSSIQIQRLRRHV